MPNYYSKREAKSSLTSKTCEVLPFSCILVSISITLHEQFLNRARKNPMKCKKKTCFLGISQIWGVLDTLLKCQISTHTLGYISALNSQHSSSFSA